VLGSGQQHRRVADVVVVAAGMHHASVTTGVVQASGLIDRQCVHVGPQAQPARAVTAHQLPHHTGTSQAALNRVAPAVQLVGHQGRGAVLVECQLRMAVDVMAQGDESIGLRVRFFKKRVHGQSLTAAAS
jgi:NAD(P)H-dependent FMN reductase